MIRIAILTLVILSTLTAKNGYPRIANYFLDPTIRQNEIDSLAQCDILVLDHEVARQSPHIIDSIRTVNPEITILAYIVSEEIELDSEKWIGSLRSSLFKEIQDSWWLKNSNGEYISFWPGTRMLNIAAYQSERAWNRYLADIITDSILTDSHWDGIYIDNCWSTVSWQDSLMDVTGEGIADEPYLIDSLWKSGMNQMLELIRTDNPSKVIVGNGGYEYGAYLNGALFEDFPRWGGWYRLFDAYTDLEINGVTPSFNMINGTTSNSGKQNYQSMRFGLASTLMGNGYFSYDYGADDHSQHWWFDEYNADLGQPLEDAQIQGETVENAIDFESGYEEWKAGDLKMSGSIVEDSLFKSQVFRVITTGEEEWNDLIGSPELSLAKGSLIKCSMKLRVEKVSPGAHLYVSLRQGEAFDSEISLGTLPISPISDTVISFYSDSAIIGTGYTLHVGLRGTGIVVLDDIHIESTENLTLSRKFERGVVLLNPSPLPKDFSYPAYHRLRGTQDPLHNDGSSASTVTLDPNDGIILQLNDVSVQELKKSVSPISIEIIGKRIVIDTHSETATTVSICDFQGRLVHTYDFGKGEIVAFTPQSGTGIYTLIITSGSQKVFRKIQL